MWGKKELAEIEQLVKRNGVDSLPWCEDKKKCEVCKRLRSLRDSTPVLYFKPARPTEKEKLEREAATINYTLRFAKLSPDSFVFLSEQFDKKVERIKEIERRDPANRKIRYKT
jgi:hypothetical protein